MLQVYYKFFYSQDSLSLNCYNKQVKKLNIRFLYTLFSAIIILSGAYLAIRYAKGNLRLNDQGILGQVGLLSANSFPTGAQIFINDKLTSATDDTIYLEPGEYQVRVVKEGYSPWQKTLQIEQELVAQTNALLFPTAPSIVPLTFTGVQKTLPSPDGQKILYYTASSSTKTKNGLYLLEMNSSFLSLQKGSRQVSNDIPTFNLVEANYIWSPDSSEILILGKNKSFLLPIDKKNDIAYQKNVHNQIKNILSTWEEEMYLRERQFLAEFPPEIIKIATTSAKNVYISPDKKRLLYTAITAVTLADELVPPIPAKNTQAQNRQLEPGGIYIYDREEDVNFKIGNEAGEALVHKPSILASDLDQKKPKSLEASPSAFAQLQATTSAQTARNFAYYHTSLFINTLQWYPDSKHVIFADDNKIEVMEYDAANKTTLYAGPFADKFLYPWPDGSKIVILTSFSPDSPKNLYAIEVKR